MSASNRVGISALGTLVLLVGTVGVAVILARIGLGTAAIWTVGVLGGLSLLFSALVLVILVPIAVLSRGDW